MRWIFLLLAATAGPVELSAQRPDVADVHELRAIIGFSMGAEQAFQWAVSYPLFADKIVATSGTAKCWPHGVVRLEAQIISIEAYTGMCV